MGISEEQIKSKVISFRLSDQEYGTADYVSRKYGFTSVSHFARSAVLMHDSNEPASSPLDAEINKLWRRIEALTSALERLTKHLGMALNA